MTDHTPASQAASTNQLSNEYVNAVIQQHGYQSPEAVIARLNQWIGLHGGEDSVTLLMYEAQKVLSKLRAPVADDLTHRLRCKYAMGPMINGEPEFGWRDCSGPAPEGMRLPSLIMLEAAAAIERLSAQLSECAETLGADKIDEQRAMRAYADVKALLGQMTHL
ncbi:hypothetical protein LMG26690_01294 [Achromobacter animicus]|uniref:Uncharacterized protein n=1 Tax=Achromobacter animicus TaxID=1389935 RepID=A0A6S6ZH72_9BURK|nr:hypothetical protein [Achromobacter animicus]CAB3675354.1 hypothetical protein LMG26690_01294 [Achromobacter animicus]